jgi:hypothetical protein
MFNPSSTFLLTALVPAICLFSFTIEDEGQNNIFEAAFQGKRKFCRSLYNFLTKDKFSSVGLL